MSRIIGGDHVRGAITATSSRCRLSDFLQPLTPIFTVDLAANKAVLTRRPLDVGESPVDSMLVRKHSARRVQVACRYQPEACLMLTAVRE